MTKQRLEKTVKDMLYDVPNTYYMKLQVNPMAHTPTPGDFLFITYGRNNIIECKECSGTSFAFSRFTQKKALLLWQRAILKNKGYIVISFWKGTRKKSTYYPIRVDDFDDIIKNISKKSVNEADLARYRLDLYEFQTLKWLF